MALTDSLVAWWCPSRDDTVLENEVAVSGNGTTTLTDLSGKGNHGTLTNMDPATDWVADTTSGGVRALDHDGVNDFIATPLTSVPADEHSISIWNKRISTKNGFFIAQRGTGGDQFQMWTGTGDTRLNYWNGSVTSQSTGSYTNDVWQHLGVTRKGTAIRFYIDGVLAGTATSAIPAQSTANVAIMTDKVGTFAQGLWDDCRIASRAWTDAEWALLASKRGYQHKGLSRIIAAHYAARRGCFL